MARIENVTDNQICVRTGRDNTDYCFYFVPPHGSIRVKKVEAEAIAARVKRTRTVGIIVSGILPKPIEKPTDEIVPEASVPVMEVTKEDEEKE